MYEIFMLITAPLFVALVTKLVDHWLSDQVGN
ncbi:hypothetical protein ABID30_003113 [Enterococcus rotai]|nr:type I toxin-antitoxin system Fst family toxin [Enterococcus rotai]